MHKRNQYSYNVSEPSTKTPYIISIERRNRTKLMPPNVVVYLDNNLLLCSDVVQFSHWICIQYYHQPQDVLERSQLPSGIFVPQTIYNNTTAWPMVMMTWAVFGCDTSLWKIILNQTTNTEDNNLQRHTSANGPYTGDKQLQNKVFCCLCYIYDLYVVFMPPYSIFTQRFREYWNYGNGIKMCTGGTSYILQECSYKDIIQLQDLHNIIIFDLSIENCSGVKTLL